MIDFLFRITEQKARLLWRFTAQVHCAYVFVAGSRPKFGGCLGSVAGADRLRKSTVSCNRASYEVRSLMRSTVTQGFEVEAPDEFRIMADVTAFNARFADY